MQPGSTSGEGAIQRTDYSAEAYPHLRVTQVPPAWTFGARPAALPGGKAGRKADITAPLERAVEDVLNRAQREILLDYKACLIPPRNLS